MQISDAQLQRDFTRRSYPAFRIVAHSFDGTTEHRKVRRALDLLIASDVPMMKQFNLAMANCGTDCPKVHLSGR
jgi:hypothetical protein